MASGIEKFVKSLRIAGNRYMTSGIEMLAKSLGIDFGKIQSDFTSLKDGVTSTLTGIDARLARIEEKQEQIWRILTVQSLLPNQQEQQKNRLGS